MAKYRLLDGPFHGPGWKTCALCKTACNSWYMTRGLPELALCLKRCAIRYLRAHWASL